MQQKCRDRQHNRPETASRELGEAYKKSGLYYWIKNNGIKQVVIGNVLLIPKDDVMAKIRGK